MRLLAHDHVRGDRDARLTIVEYGDYECPHTRNAQRSVDRLLASREGLRIVYRHFPLRAIHPTAELLARVAEAADLQGKYWAMHDELMRRGSVPDDDALAWQALSLGLDLAQIAHDIAADEVVSRIACDLELGLAHGVSSTPTFFFGERRYDGAYDYASLAAQLT